SIRVTTDWVCEAARVQLENHGGPRANSLDRNASLPFEPCSTVKKLSSIEVVVALPPNSAASAGWLNGTTKRYCAAVPSMYWLLLVGVMPLTNAPLRSFGFSSLLAGLKTFFQLLARFTIAAAVL